MVSAGTGAHAEPQRPVYMGKSNAPIRRHPIRLVRLASWGLTGQSSCTLHTVRCCTLQSTCIPVSTMHQANEGRTFSLSEIDCLPCQASDGHAVIMTGKRKSIDLSMSMPKVTLDRTMNKVEGGTSEFTIHVRLTHILLGREFASSTKPYPEGRLRHEELKFSRADGMGLMMNNDGDDEDWVSSMVDIRC